MDHTLAEQRPDECSKEPIMKPARPSSPRNQDVSYVLANVFGDLYSQDVLHEDTIINLETSRTHDPDFHDYYVQLLNEIRTERTERLAALKQVEEHMMSAYKLASEQNLSLKQDNTKTTLGIPERHIGIGSFLDTDLLGKYNLLTPGSYLRPSPPSLKSPTVPDLPNFMRNTEVMEEHEKARKVTINRDPAAITPSKMKRSTLSAGNIKVRAPVKAAWRDSMNPDIRNQEQKGLEKLQAKSNFLKTRRFDKEEEEQIFCTVPSQILFNSYKIGEVYDQKIKIKNVSISSRQLKVLPPRTKHFTIAKSIDPSENGAVAPGLSVEYTISFIPDSLGSYEDTLQIIPQGGSLTNVALIAERPPPALSLPDVLDCGYCLIHGTLRTQFRCTNKGGHAIFQLYPVGTLSEPFLFNDLPPPRFELQDHGFTISPTSFVLDHGQEVVLDVQFKPTEVARLTSQFTIAADNCTLRDYTLTAESESCSVTIIAVSGGASTVDYDIRTSTEEGTVAVNFEDQNPGTVEEKIFILRNCVNVPLHYTWEMCKVLTEEEKADKVLLMADEISPFKISPNIGILEPSSETSFSIICNPLKAGKYDNIGRLWVDDIPTLQPSGLILERYDAQHLKLCHLAQPHRIRLDPPALVVPGESVVGYTISKTVKIVNDSLSTATVKWKCPNNTLKFSIRPETFTVGAGCSRTVEVDIESQSAGDKETHILCYFENVEKPASLFVKAKFRGPQVMIDANQEDPALDFGYIHFKPGCSVQRQFDMYNKDGVSASWSLSEMEHCIDKDYGQSEFQFSEDSGTIGPYEIRHIHVIFKPHYPRSLKSVIECQIENGTGSKIRVVGEIQEPNVVLKQSVIDLGVIYVGVPVKSSVFFESLNFADCTYSIYPAEGKDKAFGFVEFSEVQGTIYAGATYQIEFKYTGREPATIDDYTVAIQIGDNKVLALGIKAVVKGLDVIHETPALDQIAPETKAERFEPPSLDFGTAEILTPVTRVLKIINNSNIATHFNLEIDHFKGAISVAPPISALGATQFTEHTYRPASHLLSKSALMLDPTSKSRRQQDADYWRKQLSNNQGACFTATPSSGYLPGNGVTIVTVHGNSDMWGEYSDVLISKVGDMEPVVVPIRMEVVNSPLYYKLSNNNRPTVRFGCYPLNEEPVSRTVQISNQGPLDIRLDWDTFNVIPADKTLIDLDFYVGDAFPNKDPAISNRGKDADRDFIRLVVTPHEGQRSTGPFKFTPDQCTVPGRGTSKVTLMFDPTGHGIGGCDGDFKSFALAYQSLDTHRNTVKCRRLEGEDVPPLRIMITGKVEVPEVVVTAEEHGFTFKLMAGMINSRVHEHTKIHKMSLLNSSKLHLKFSIAACPPFILLDKKEHYTLIPRQKIKVDHGFVLSKKLLQVLLDSSKQHFRLDIDPVSGEFREADNGLVEINVEEKLLRKSHEVKQSDGNVETVVQQVPEKKFHLHSHIKLHYHNGHVQSIPVHGRIVLPTLYISPQTVDFGTCLVDQTSQLTVRLINPSNSPLRWRTEYSGDSVAGEYSISPSEGEFTMSDSVLLSLSYTAKTRTTSVGAYSFVSSPGNRVVHLSLSGTGSHDERMQRLL